MRKSLYPQITLLLTLLSIAVAHADDLSSQQIYKQCVPSIMTLNVDNVDGKAYIGTGFMAIKDGIAVTAWHVVNGAKSVTATFSNGEKFEVSGLIDKDEKRDIALVRVKVFGRPLLPLATTAPEIGSKMCIIGAPQGYDFTLSDGIISQIRNDDGVNYYQFTCPATHGDSGGPMINTSGQVAGVVDKGVDDAPNIVFAVPSTYVLGLDSTLPTQQWDSVKKDIPAQNTSSSKEIDQLFATTTMDYIDLHSAYDMVESEYSKHRGYEIGVPRVLYVVIKESLDDVDKLNAIASADPARESIRTDLIAGMTNTLMGTDLETQSVKKAQADYGWTPEAMDLNSQANAYMATSHYPRAKIQELYNSSSDFRDALSDLAAILLTLKPDPAIFRMGWQSWIRDPQVITVVMPGTYAEKWGFEIGDAAVALDDVPMTSFKDIEVALGTRLGKHVKVTVLRDGKNKDLKFKLPDDLTRN